MFVVVDEWSALNPGDHATVLAHCEDEAEASLFIATNFDPDDVASGRYGIDGPAED